MGIDSSLKEPSLYIRMLQSLLQTKSFICIYSYSYTVCYSSTRSPTVLCSMQNTNTVTVAHFIAWKTSRTKRIGKRSIIIFTFQLFKGYNYMDAGASLREKGNYSRLAWTALHTYCKTSGLLYIPGNTTQLPIKLARISIHRSCTVHNLWVIHSWLMVSHYKWKTKAQK